MEKTISFPNSSLDIPAPKRILWLSLALGWTADLLFYGQQLGVSVVIFVGLLLVTGWINGRFANIRPQNRWLIVPLLFFASMIFIRANEFLTFFNVLATLALLAYLAFFYAAGKVSNLGLLGTVMLPARVSGHAFIEAAPVVRSVVNWRALREQGWSNVFPIVRGGLLALPILFIFTALLMSADVIFADYINEALDLDILPEVMARFWRGVWILLMSWVIAGGFVYMIGRQKTAVSDDQGALERGFNLLRNRLPLGYLEAMTVLGLVNGLFLAFTAVQFTYLFGGQINLSQYSYAEYARRGFFELVAVAVLSLGLIIGLNWITRRENKRQIKGFNLLGMLMIGFVLIMLVSAFRRMGLYEAIFGYTELRLIVFVFMIWLAVVLVWFLITLWWQPDRFAIGLLLCGIGFLATMNLVNPDAFIVQRNIEHYEKTQKLDVDYLASLSADAVPELKQAITAVSHDDQVVLKPECRRRYREEIPPECETTLAALLRDNLTMRRERMETDTAWRQCQAFHLARWQAFSSLQNEF
ncbi:MAG: DUF4173 domain-containing protein [Chloroflexota bacterium]